MTQRRIKRRDFLRGAFAAGAGFAIGNRSAWSTPIGSNEEIRVALVGLGGRGGGFLVNAAEAQPDVKIVALCDPHSSRMNGVYNNLDDNSEAVRYTDVREIIDRNDIDVFMLASPTHWHALMTVWACQAGMDVYCEKPVSHNVPESRIMQRAAAYYNRVVQIGTQRRSSYGAEQARQFLAGGTLGAIQWMHCWWFSGRGGVGLQNPPWNPYTVNGFDWNMYAGPASDGPIPWGSGILNATDIHSNWHFNWLYGNGDASNLGVHVFDQARFMAGTEGAPTRVMCVGNRYVHNDGGQTPNAQLSLMDYPDYPVAMENRGLVSENLYGSSRGVRIQCENGYVIGFDDATAFNNDDELIGAWNAGNPEGDHSANFFAAVRSRDVDSLIAPIAKIIPSNDGCLLANASYRMGTPTPTADIRAAIAGMGDAPNRFEDILNPYLSGVGVNTAVNPLIMGPWLTFDAAAAAVTQVNGSAESGSVETANGLLADPYREPFVLPAIPDGDAGVGAHWRLTR
jgi:predicted dehydrogenase